MGSHAITYAVVALAIAAACLFAGFAWGRSNVKAQIEEAVEKEHVALDAREFAMRTQLEDAIAELARLRPQAEELGRVQKRLEREQAKYAQMRAEFNSAMGVAPEPSADEEPEPVPVESADEAIHKLLQSLEAFNDPNAPAAAEPVVSSNPAPANPAPPKPAPASAVPVAAPAAPPAASRPPENPRPVVAPKPADVVRPAVAARPAAPGPPAPPIPAPPPTPRVVAPAAATPARIAPPQQQKPAPVPPRTPVPSPPARPATADSGKSGQKVDEWQEFARQLEALTGKKK